MLEELYASYNYISDIYDLSYSDNLTVLDLEGNLIATVEQLRSLRNLPYLESVNIKGNPILKAKTSKKEIVQLLSNVQSIDADSEDEIADNNEQAKENEDVSLIARLLSLGLAKEKLEQAKEQYIPEDTQSDREQIVNGMKNPKCINAEMEGANISDELAVAGNAMNALRTKQKIIFSNRKDCQIDKLIGEFEKDSETFQSNIKSKLCKTSNGFDV